jgi:GT2 family glycosyltransferase
MNDLSVIIVSWNCRQDLDGALRSILAGQEGLAIEIILVDNNSDDGTVEFVAKNFPAVTILKNDRNVGFAAANNQAMRVAQGRYILLLNPDTITHPNALTALVQFMDRHTTAWAVGPMLLNRDDTKQRTGVRFPNAWNILSETFFLDRLFPYSRLFGRHKELYRDPEVARTVDYVQGSCLMVRAEVLTRLGVLDEQFFMYFEETDWCYRMRENGGEVWIEPAARVIHFGGSDAGHYDARRLVHYHRSLLQFYRKHYSSASQIALRAVLILRSFVRILVWFAFLILQPRLRTHALSAIKGYLSTLALSFTPTSGTRHA